MRTRFGFLYHKYFFLTLAAGILFIAFLGLHPRAAYADGGTIMPDRLYSTGPFQLQNGERVLIGLLLPAIQKVRESPSFSILDSSGKELFRARPGPPTDPNASFFSSFFDITYRAASPNGGGVFDIRGKGTPGGGDIVTVPTADGVLIGLLLPAIQPNGMTASPLATSMQSFNANGGTMTQSSFFDVFVRPDPQN
jgi:hypothetical protein